MAYIAIALSVLLAQSIGVNGQNATNLTSDGLPVVDFTYARYRPTSYDANGDYYNFSNIRYAAPPVGDLRWKAPYPPLNERAIQDGSLGYICPQATPDWFSDSVAGTPDQGVSIPPATSGQTESEDCLFLDVIVPKSIYDLRNEEGVRRAPVLINIHGGGNFMGDKTTIYWPGGLLEQASNNLIYVSMNYRLGALGFLSGLTPSGANSTSPNAGLLDQRYAIQWVRKYIGLFGGNGQNITLIGESAGGSNILYHTMAYGASKQFQDIFQGGIAQSPLLALSKPRYAKEGANKFMSELGVSSLDEARKLPTEKVTAANLAAQKDMPHFVIYFWPSIDGDLIPDQPARLFEQGKFYKNIDMLVSNNKNEGLLFSNKTVTTDAEYDNWVNTYYATSPPDFVQKIKTTYFPPSYNNNSYGYINPQERLQKTITELIFACSVYATISAFNNSLYSLQFAIPPAYHAQDLAYTFYPTGKTPTFYPEVAKTLQTYYVNLATTGNPNRPHPVQPQYPLYGSTGRTLNVTVDGPKEILAPNKNAVCEYMLTAPYVSG